MRKWKTASAQAPDIHTGRSQCNAKAQSRSRVGDYRWVMDAVETSVRNYVINGWSDTVGNVCVDVTGNK